MFEHSVLAQNLAVHSSRLLDDASERDDKDHSSQSVAHHVPQGEGKRRECLSAAGRNGERKEARRPIRGGAAVIEYTPAKQVHGSRIGGREFVQARVKTLPKSGNLSFWDIAFPCLEEGLRIQEVGIN